MLQGSIEVVTFEDGVEVAKVTGGRQLLSCQRVMCIWSAAASAAILFNLYSPDGRLTQMLDKQGMCKTVTIENVLKQFAN